MFHGHRSHPSLLKVPKSFKVLVVVLVFLYSVVCGMVLVQTRCSVVRGVVLMVLTSCLVVLDYFVYYLIIISSNYEQLLGTTPRTTEQLLCTSRTICHGPQGPHHGQQSNWPGPQGPCHRPLRNRSGPQGTCHRRQGPHHGSQGPCHGLLTSWSEPEGLPRTTVE